MVTPTKEATPITAPLKKSISLLNECDIKPATDEKITKNSPAEIAFFKSTCKKVTKIGTRRILPPTPISMLNVPKTKPMTKRTPLCTLLCAFPTVVLKKSRISAKSAKDKKIISSTLSSTLEAIKPLSIAPQKPPMPIVNTKGISRVFFLLFK